MSERRAVEAKEHFGREHGIVLGERVAAFHLHAVARRSGVGVKEPGLLNHPGEGVAVSAQQAVRRPQIQGVTAPLLQAIAVVLRLPPEPGHVPPAEPVGDLWIRHGVARPHVLGAHLAMGGEREALAVPPEGREEDLEGVMRVQGAGDLGDAVEVPIDESRQAVVVLEGAAPAPSRHEEAALRKAEVALAVHDEEAHVPAVRAHGPQRVLASPAHRGLEQRRGVGAVGEEGCVFRTVEVGKRQLLRCRHDPTSVLRGACAVNGSRSGCRTRPGLCTSRL